MFQLALTPSMAVLIPFMDFNLSSEIFGLEFFSSASALVDLGSFSAVSDLFSVKVVFLAVSSSILVLKIMKILNKRRFQKILVKYSDDLWSYRPPKLTEEAFRGQIRSYKVTSRKLYSMKLTET